MSRLFDLDPPEGGMNMQIDQEKDLSPFNDGGIRKVLKQHGHGDDYPNAGDTVTLRYVAYCGEEMAPEYIFDSSDRDDKDFTYEVCRGKVVRGFELAVMSMKPGERAIIYLQPEYAFGRAGAPPKVPRDTPVIFDTRIFKLECEDLSFNKDKSILKKVLKKGKGWSQPNEGCMLDVHIKASYDNVTYQDDDFTFPFGEGPSKEFHIPRFVEEFLDQWKIGEISRMVVEAKHAFGEQGYPDLGVPPNKDVTYIIEMRNFERVKDIWEMNNDQKLKQCVMFKEKGNMYYKREEWSLALKFYNKMLDFVQFDICMRGEEEKRRHAIMVFAFLNKAMVLLKLEKYMDARHCCDKVIDFDKNYVKAFYRRGLTFFHTNDWREAKKDFEEVVKLDPSNKPARNHISICNRRIKESAGDEKKLYQSMMSGVGKMGGADPHMYGSGMNDIDNWDNNMAEGMMTLEEEREAFGEPIPTTGGNNHGLEH